MFDLPSGFKVYEVASFDKEIEQIKVCDKTVIYRSKGFYYSKTGDRLSRSENLVFNVGKNVAFAKLNNNDVEIYIPELNIKTTIMNNIEKLYVFNDKLFIYKNKKLSNLDLIIANNKVIAGIKNSWDLFHHQNVNEFMLFINQEKEKLIIFMSKIKMRLLILIK